MPGHDRNKNNNEKILKLRINDSVAAEIPSVLYLYLSVEQDTVTMSSGQQYKFSHISNGNKRNGILTYYDYFNTHSATKYKCRVHGPLKIKKKN